MLAAILECMFGIVGHVVTVPSEMLPEIARRDGESPAVTLSGGIGFDEEPIGALGLVAVLLLAALADRAGGTHVHMRGA